MWFRNQRTQIESKAARSSKATRRRSPKFGPRTVEGLEDRSLMSHVVHPVMAHDVHALATHQTRFVQTNLVSDGAVPAAVTDPKLVNPWGLVASATSPWWVNDNGTGFSTLYNGTGAKQALVVTIPPPTGSPAGTTATPTGIVFNGNTSEFLSTAQALPRISSSPPRTARSPAGTRSTESARSSRLTTRPRSIQTAVPARFTRAWRWRTTVEQTSCSPRTSAPAQSTCSTAPSIR